MEENCLKCKERIKADNSIQCEGICKKSFHLKCVNISGKEYNIVKHLSNFKWLCDSCMPYLNSTMQIRKEFTEFKETILNEIRELKEKPGGSVKSDNPKNNITYSNVVSGEAVIIKPKAKQDCSKTKETVIKKLKPSAMEVGITQVKNIKDGGILIKCKTKEETEKVKTEAEKSLGRQYQIKIPQLKNPCVKVVDIEEKMDDNELLECIKKQNVFLRHDNMDIKVVTTRKMINRYMAILECDPTTHVRILEEGSLCIGWSPNCRVFDYVRIYRCFKCGGFNHKAETCDNEVCVRCGESGHKKDECQSEVLKCVNCSEAIHKLKLDLDVNHSPFDVNNCVVLQKKIITEKQKIRNEHI